MLVLCCSSDNTIFLLVRSFHLNFVEAASAAALAALAVATVVVFVVVIVFFWENIEFGPIQFVFVVIQTSIYINW